MIPGSLPADEKLVIYIGAAGALRLTFTDSLGAALDLSGRTFVAQVRDHRKRPVKVDMTVALTDLPNGVIDISWTADATLDAPVGPTRWGLLDDQDNLWIEDSCKITRATPRNT